MKANLHRKVPSQLHEYFTTKRIRLYIQRWFKILNTQHFINKAFEFVGVFRKLKQALSLREPKPNVVTQQCVVYLFKCDLCDAGYVGYTKGHLHKRVEGHREKASSIYKHYSKEHNTVIPNNFSVRFNVIKKCTKNL